MTAMRWGLRIVPKAGELLSGYLCRAAAAHGLSPHEFCSFHFGDPAFWTRDVDSLGMQRNHEKIARKAGVTTEEVYATSLAAWQSVLVSPRYQKNLPVAVTPWINAVGVFHRKRRQYALQFCPLCLEEDGFIRREWRLSFVVACERHGMLLQDACPRCGAAFIPHRSGGRGHKCHACHLKLVARHSSADTAEAPPPDLGPLIEVQLEMHAELRRAAEPAGLAEVSERLLGLRDLVSVIGSVRFADRLPDIAGIGSTSRTRSFRVEFSRLEQRVMALSLVRAVTDDWPAGFRSLSERLRLTRLSFAPLEPLPGWLAVEVEALPPGVPRRPRPAGGRLECRIARITDRRSENWRAARAEAMMRAAGGAG